MKTGLILLLFTFSCAAHGTSKNFYVGAGPLYEFPGTIRAGYDEWEAGMMTTTVFGINRVFHSGAKYLSFGFVVTAQDSYGLGVFGAAGLDWEFLGRLSLRAEINSVGAHHGYTKTEACVGLGYKF